MIKIFLKEGKRMTPTCLMFVDIAGAKRVLMKIDGIEAFSQHCSFYSIYFHQALSAPAISTDVSQVGVALFLLFKVFFIISAS